MRTRLISFVSVLCLTVSVYASDMNLSDASILFEKKSISEIDVPHVDIASTDVYYRSMHLTTGSMDMLHSSLCGSRVGRINADGLSVCLSVCPTSFGTSLPISSRVNTRTSIARHDFVSADEVLASNTPPVIHSAPPAPPTGPNSDGDALPLTTTWGDFYLMLLLCVLYVLYVKRNML